MVELDRSCAAAIERFVLNYAVRAAKMDCRALA
jgi:hypothetical protein